VKIRKSTKGMIRAALVAAALGSSASAASAAVVLSDNFDAYTNGNLSTQGGWTATAAAATPMQVAGAADKYVQFGTSGQDEYKAFSSVIPHTDGNTLTTSFTLNASAAAAAGDYFIHLSDPVGTASNFYQRLFIKSSGTGYQLGLLGSATSTPGYGSGVLNFNQDYDIDIAWTFVAGAKNDTFVITADNTNYLNYTWDVASAAEPTAQISAANFRQGTAANSGTVQVDDLVIDGIVPEPTGLGVLAMGAVLAFRRRRN
jgi:hypothetical protein